MDLSSPQFWIAVLQIILIDIVLSGDNAVVIGLACCNLPPRQHRRSSFAGALLGSVAAKVIHLVDVPVLLIK
jgi:predicted tellurium resistance membrane protein TerC